MFSGAIVVHEAHRAASAKCSLRPVGWLACGLVLLRDGERVRRGRRRAGGRKLLRLTGKPPKLAFLAVARMPLTILNAIAREKTAWQA